MRPLDRSSPMPLWAQLEADLQTRLSAGEFHERFPTDAELTDQYEVSRHTVREAVRHLNKSGVLRRERGRGTVVNDAGFEQSLGTLYSLFRSIEATGAVQNSEVVELALRRNTVAAAELDLDENEELVYIERLRLADDLPLAVDRAWLPASFASPILDADFTHTALYDELERACGLRPTSGRERLTPVVPSASDRTLLKLRKSDAAFFLERLGVANGVKIEWRQTVIRGDRFRFVAEWEPGSSPSMTLRQTQVS